MRNTITTKELLEKRFSKEKSAQIIESANLEIDEINWGGAREGAGRKPKDAENVLKFQVRVSEREKEFLKYARAHNLNYEDLMQG